MRIRIDLTPAVQQHAGLGRYAEELTHALIGLRSGDEFGVFYVDPLGRVPAPPLDGLPSKALRWSNKPWRMRTLLSSYARVPMDSLLGDGDVFHATDHLLPHLGRMRSVFTLHDLIPLKHPEIHLPLNRWYSRLTIPLFLRRADAIICVSQDTKNDAVRFFGLDRSRIWVIPEGVNPRFQPVRDPAVLAGVRARYNLPKRFVLNVGTIEPRKNLISLWEAYRALRTEGNAEKLVVVGKKGWLYQETFVRLRELGLEGEVIFPGYVPDEDLPALYTLAECFTFPSLSEGFGLPPLEAMACGCPVVCSNSSSLPEVCGDAAILVPPTDVANLTAALRRVIREPALQGELRVRGLKQAARFTWQSTARRTLEVYRSVVQRERGRAVHHKDTKDTEKVNG